MLCGCDCFCLPNSGDVNKRESDVWCAFFTWPCHLYVLPPAHCVFTMLGAQHCVTVILSEVFFLEKQPTWDLPHITWGEEGVESLGTWPLPTMSAHVRCDNSIHGNGRSLSLTFSIHPCCCSRVDKEVAQGHFLLQFPSLFSFFKCAPATQKHTTGSDSVPVHSYGITKAWHHSPVTFLTCRGRKQFKGMFSPSYCPFLASAISWWLPPTLRLLQRHQKWERWALNPQEAYQPHIYSFFFPPRMPINDTDTGSRVKTHFPVEITPRILSASVSYFS